jgi:hypothetical protein
MQIANGSGALREMLAETRPSRRSFHGLGAGLGGKEYPKNGHSAFSNAKVEVRDVTVEIRQEFCVTMSALFRKKQQWQVRKAKEEGVAVRVPSAAS